MKEKILLPLRRFPCFVLFMYLLGLICLMIVHQGGRHVSVFELLVDVYVLTLFLSLLPKKIALWTKRVFYVIAYSLALVDMFCYCRLGATAHQCRPITNLPGDQPAGSHRGPVLLFDAFRHLLPCHSDSPVDGVAYIRIMEKSQYPHQYLRVGWYLRPHVLRH